MSLPEITYRYPTEVSGPISELQPTITIDWSVDMETSQFSDDADRAQNIVLLDIESGLALPTSYIDYTTASRRLEIAPTSDLTRGKYYRVIVKDKLLSTDGRRSFNSYNWTFLTASGSITEPTLVNPGNATVQAIFPNLYWSTVSSTGLVSYVVQIDDSWTFNSLAYTTTTTATSITPVGTFDQNTTYYWRVMAYTSNATGAWSDVRSFYYGILENADPTSRQTLPPSDRFGVARLGSKNGLSHQAAHPSPLSFTFTSTPASSFSDYIEVVSKWVLPRNDDEDTYDDTTEAGSWTISGSTITFAPTDAIVKNKRYEIHFKSTMLNTDGFELGTDYIYYWTGKYDPFYVSPRVIRSRFLGAEQQVPDDLINYYIHMASLEAKARYYGYLQNPVSDSGGDSLDEVSVRDSTNLRSYGVLKWVEAATAYKLLKAILFENLRDIGRTERLGDTLISLTADFVKGIEKALEEVKDELDQWENLLIPSDVPTMVPKGFNWDPRTFDYDWGIGRDIGPRDDCF